MNLPRYSLDNRKVIFFFLAILLVGGIVAFTQLGKKEDSPFVIKSAAIVTRYPGATPEEVEQLITEPIEREIQSMRRVYKITSESWYGMSKIMIELQPSTPAGEMPQMWDELRRKIMNVQPALPDGASNISVSDDFGDVFGIYYGLSADEGFTYEEMRDWAQRIKTELVTVPGVQKVTLFGEQNGVVNVYLSMSALGNLFITPDEVIRILSGQNTLVGSGEKMAGQMQIKIIETGTYKNLDDIRNQILTSTQGLQVRLGDIARIEAGYAEPPGTLMRVNGRRAIGIGVSTDPEKDVVKTGALIERKLAELNPQIPIGITLQTLYPENQIAREANNTFIVNLIESISIVIVLIMLIMGLRAGILIGSSLIFAIGGTLLIMQFLGVGLNRTSLAGFIIAMGMLVDNAIVVTDNAQNAILRGARRRQALIDGATGPQWGLLGATFIAICSFLPLYLAPSAVAEIVKPLFVVVAISLLLSWMLALSQTPLFGSYILKEQTQAAPRDPYDRKFYRLFDQLLERLIRRRWWVAGIMVALFAGSLLVMGAMPQNFFPNLDKPYFRADCFLPDGYNIRDMERNIMRLEEWLLRQPSVKNVSATMGSSPPRYYLASTSFGPKPNFGNLLVELTAKDSTAAVEERFNAYARANFPDLLVRSSLFKLSPAVEAAIEIGFIGPDIDTLAALTEQTERLMREIPEVTDIRSSWGNPIPVWEPVYSQEKGPRLGITRLAAAQQMTIATSGYQLGEYRHKDQFMPILLVDDDRADFNLNNLRSVPIYSPKGNVYPLEQVVDRFDFGFRYGTIKRYKRERVMMAQCDPVRGANTKAAFGKVLEQVRSRIALPEGYDLKIFGEEQGQQESNAALAANMPLTFILIFITLLLLFRTYKKPVVIVLMVPMIFIGVVVGLLATGKQFDFFAMLGLLGLVGMNIKNAIVLVDQIGAETAVGKSPYDAVLSATRSRIVPVMMASGTTILGMLPLLFDSMFGGMAATIMGGLLVASLLTILVLPVAYCLFFGIRKPAPANP